MPTPIRYITMNTITLTQICNYYPNTVCRFIRYSLTLRRDLEANHSNIFFGFCDNLLALLELLLSKLSFIHEQAYFF